MRCIIINTIIIATLKTAMHVEQFALIFGFATYNWHAFIRAALNKHNPGTIWTWWKRDSQVHWYIIMDGSCIITGGVIDGDPGNVSVLCGGNDLLWYNFFPKCTHLR